LAKDKKVIPRSGMNKREKVIVRKDPLGAVLIIGKRVQTNKNISILILFLIRLLELPCSGRLEFSFFFFFFLVFLFTFSIQHDQLTLVPFGKVVL
jgi:hypothetical protein